MNLPVTIGMVDDQALFRQGLHSLLKKYEQFRVVLEVGGGTALLNALHTTLPEILLLDLDLPGMNGVEINALLQRDYPSIKVIIVTMYNQVRFIRKMIEAGACGYLVKNADADELVCCIETVSRTGFYFSGDTLHAFRHAPQQKEQPLRNINRIPIELTCRETEVLQLICTEMTNSEIGERLHLSPRTVDGHRTNLLIKTGCRNTAGLVVFAIRYGLFEAGF